MTWIIDDSNYARFVEQHLDRTGGELGLLPRDYRKVPLSSIPGTSPFTTDFPIIPETEWPDRIKAMQGNFPRHIYTGTPAEDTQNGLRYCWAFSLSQAIKGARDRDGQPKVDLLSESLGRDVNWRSVGNYCGSAIECAAKYGMCDRSFSPKRYNLEPSTWKAGWEAEALNHRVLEWWELGHQNMRAETISALLYGFGVFTGLNWAGHAMWFAELQMQGGKPAIWTPNTWGDNEDWLLTGSKMIPDEAFVVRVGCWSEK